MPALPDAPQVIRIHLEYLLGTAHGGGSRFYFEYTGGPPSVANLNTLSSDVSSAWATDLAPITSQYNKLVGVTCTDLTSPTSAEGAWTGNIAGGLTGTYLMVESAGCFNSVIARRYRGGKPRIFLPVGDVENTNSDGDTWTSAFITGADAAWVSFKTALQALTGIGCTLTNHVNVSYYKGFASVQNPVTLRWSNIPTPRTTAVIDQIESTNLAATLSQQRRRRFTPHP